MDEFDEGHDDDEDGGGDAATKIDEVSRVSSKLISFRNLLISACGNVQIIILVMNIITGFLAFPWNGRLAQASGADRSKADDAMQTEVARNICRNDMVLLIYCHTIYVVYL